MWQHADIARQEYLAVGIRVALRPQIDLATEPRWSRINGTFGEDADLRDAGRSRRRRLRPPWRRSESGGIPRVQHPVRPEPMRCPGRPGRPAGWGCCRRWECAA
ncbi:hypothetical protein [Streptomyces sp. NPDC048473]|uniref:hypothetical protein n=1 Tax=unclassified Streptomyces TaxID=2593676 RepID=UPI00371FF446